MRYINHSLAVVSVVCLFLVFKSSDEPLLSSNYGWVFEQFSIGNTIIFNMASGILVSIWFYFLVVYLPELFRTNRIKRHFIAQYKEFRRQLIIHILSSCRKPHSHDLVESLIETNTFKDYFKEKVTEDQERWDVFLNNVDEQVLDDILLEFEAFKESISYLLTSVDVQDEEVFAFLHRIKTIYTTQKNVNISNDSLKQLSRLLWEMLAGFSWTDGYRGYDYFAKMFAKI